MKAIILQHPLRLVAVISIIILTSSCSFYRAVPDKNYSSQTIKQYEEDGKYLILQRDSNAWRMYDISYTNDSIHAIIDPWLGYHSKYLNPKPNGLNQFKKKDEPEVINSVHVYTSDTNFNYFDSRVSIPVSSINTVVSYNYARAPSRASKIVPIVFIPFALIAVAIAASPAPRISVSGNTSWSIK